MTLADSLLFDGVTLKEDRQRQVAEMLAELGFCTVEEQVQLKCYYCDAEIDPNAVTPPNHECPECERSIETDRCEQRETLMIRIDRPSTYSEIRRYCKSAAGLQHSSKSSVTYRRTDKGAKQDEKIEYRFVLQNDKKQHNTPHRYYLIPQVRQSSGRCDCAATRSPQFSWERQCEQLTDLTNSISQI